MGWAARAKANTAEQYKTEKPSKILVWDSEQGTAKRMTPTLRGKALRKRAKRILRKQRGQGNGLHPSASQQE